MNGLRPQDRRALTVGAIVLLALFAYSRAIRPAFADLSRQRASLAEQKALLARERSLLAVASKLPNARRVAQRSLAAERPRLFTGDSVAATGELSSFVTGVAGATGVHLTTVDGHAPRTARGVTQLALEVRGDGTWRQMLAFVRALESSARLVDLTNVRIERGVRGGPLGGALVSVSATVAGYARGTP
jgi:type II secretory pathway component PulM